MATRFLAVATNETRNASVALGIHPTIVAQGLDGAVATELRATILAYAGSATLSRCTITQGDDNNDIWQFAGFDVSGGVMTPITIADLPNPVTFQEVQDQAFDQVMTLFPDSTQSTAFAPLEGIVDFTVPQGVSLTASPSELAAAMQVTFDLDTPSKFNANSLDCVSCHIAGRVRDHGIALGATDDGQPRFTDPPFNLGLITSERATSFAYRTMQCARLATSAMRRCSTSVWPTRARRWPACWRRYCRRNRHSSLPMG